MKNIKQLVESGAGIQQIIKEVIKDDDDGRYVDITYHTHGYQKIKRYTDKQMINAGKRIVKKKYNGDLDKAHKDIVGDGETINVPQLRKFLEATDSQEQIVDDFEAAVNRIEKSKKIIGSKGVVKDYLNWVLGMGPTRAKSMLRKGDSAIIASMKKFED